MSTKKAKKIVVYLAAFLIMLVLVCTCLVGNTFAKYITGGYGTGTAELSYWNVNLTEGSLNSSATVSFASGNGLSPDKTGDGGSENHYNSTDVNEVACIVINNGTEVNVSVTLNVTALDYTPLLSTFSFSSGIVSDGVVPSQSEVEAAFVLHAMWVKIESSTVPTTPTITVGSDGSGTVSGLPQTGATSGTITVGTAEAIDWAVGSTTTYIYLYAWVTWVTNYNTYYSAGTETNSYKLYYADLVDTWIASNITSVSTEITAVAVQNTTNPNNN